VAALGAVVSNVDEIDNVVPLLEQLGRDHRRFSVITEHYTAVGASLLATLQHFLGRSWMPDLATLWAWTCSASANTTAPTSSAGHLAR
jgi:hemoglobin-like flavoprotein